MASIKCTNCGAVLKTKDDIAPGKKVKCPKCNEPFVVQAEETAVQEDPKAANPFAFGEGQKGGDDAPTKGKGGDDGDDAASKGGDKPKKSNTMMMVLIGVAVVVFCCCPMTCGGVYIAAGQAIKAALGFGEDAAKKALDDAAKKMQEDMKKQQN